MTIDHDTEFDPKRVMKITTEFDPETGSFRITVEGFKEEHCVAVAEEVLNPQFLELFAKYLEA